MYYSIRNFLLSQCKFGEMVNKDDLIREINSKATTTTWKAKPTIRFMDFKMSDIKNLMGTYTYSNISFYPHKNKFLQLQKELLLPLIYAMNIQINSPLRLISCCGACGIGCKGGNTLDTLKYWHTNGLPTGGLYGDTTTCQPFVFPPCNHHQNPGPYEPCDIEYKETHKCSNVCIDGYNKTIEEDSWYGENYYLMTDELKIMTDIYENGPVVSGFDVYEDFVLYSEGIYQHDTGDRISKHSVKIRKIPKYWLCVNSWNDNWGNKGTFKIIRGENHLGIEEFVVAGIPLLKNKSNNNEYDEYVE